jgi:adenylylsulfate kinase
MADETHVTWHAHAVTREERERMAGHRGCVVWFTGLSGSGKSTLANLVDRMLFRSGVRSYVLDGDNIRHGLNAGPAMLAPEHGEEFAARFGLGFGAEDREENIRRVGEVARLLCDAGLVVLTAFVSPYRRDRDRVRAKFPAEDFIEVFVDAPLAVCETRDPKGLYKKARAGELPGFTGVDDPYESPDRPDLVLDSGSSTPGMLADKVVALLRARGKVA